MKLSTVLIAVLSCAPLVAEDAHVNRLVAAAKLVGAASGVIPAAIREKAQCVAAIPGGGSGLISKLGGKSGFVVCQLGGTWTGPIAIKVEGSVKSVGKTEPDLLLVMVTERGARGFLTARPNIYEKARFGTLESVVPGPTGQEVTGDFVIQSADVFVWTRSDGALEGSRNSILGVVSDNSANKSIYGREIILPIHTDPDFPPVPPVAQNLIDELKSFGPNAGKAPRSAR